MMRLIFPVFRVGMVLQIACRSYWHFNYVFPLILDGEKTNIGATSGTHWSRWWGSTMDNAAIVRPGGYV